MKTTHENRNHPCQKLIDLLECRGFRILGEFSYSDTRHHSHEFGLSVTLQTLPSLVEKRGLKGIPIVLIPKTDFNDNCLYEDLYWPYYNRDYRSD